MNKWNERSIVAANEQDFLQAGNPLLHMASNNEALSADDDDETAPISTSARKRIDQIAERRRLRRDLENYPHFNLK